MEVSTPGAWLRFTPLAVCVILTVLACYILFRKPAAPPSESDQPIAEVGLCIDKYASEFEPKQVSFASSSNAYNLCFAITQTKLLTREQLIRNDTLVFQRSENIVVMWMVVGITVSGVILAAMQLLGSYRLAMLGKAAFDVGGEGKFTLDSVVVKSSVVGVIILSISFAFFLVFVIYVYTLDDGSKTERVPPASQPSATGRPQNVVPATNIGLANIGRGIRTQFPPAPAPASQPNRADPSPQNAAALQHSAGNGP